MEENLQKVNGGTIAYMPERKPARKTPKNKPTPIDDKLVTPDGTLYRISDPSTVTPEVALHRTEAAPKISTILEKLKEREAILAPQIREYTGDKDSQEYKAMLAEIKFTRERMRTMNGTQKDGPRPDPLEDTTKKPEADSKVAPSVIPQSLGTIFIREDKIPERKPGIFERFRGWFNRGKENTSLAGKVNIEILPKESTGAQQPASATKVKNIELNTADRVSPESLLEENSGTQRGSMSAEDFVEKSLTRQGLNYTKLIAEMTKNIPPNTEPALDNESGKPYFATREELKIGKATHL